MNANDVINGLLAVGGQKLRELRPALLAAADTMERGEELADSERKRVVAALRMLCRVLP